MKKPIAIKSRFLQPYDDAGRTRLGFCKNKSGVYIIKRRSDDKIVYVGFSETNLYKTVLRHFQSWEDKKQVRVSYEGRRDKYSVRIILTTPARAAKLERALIITRRPPDNPDKLKRYAAPTPTETAIMEDIEWLRPATIDEMEEAPF